MPDSPYQAPVPTDPEVSRPATKYQTTPYQMETMPPGIPYIVGNEAAERFSFYGMKAILTVFMVDYLRSGTGELATMSDEQAKFWVHTFVVAAYFFPLIGAIVSDWIFGKYRTILCLSVIYCLGHLALALDETRVGLAIGLGLIAVGTGAIKPCVSAHVGDQFGSRNNHLLTKVFGWFYLAINLGAFISTLLTPKLLEWYGPHVAFGVPGILMAIATVVFWMGRNRFVHIPPRGKTFLKDSFTGEGLRAILRLVPLYLFVAIFWCLFDQTASAWVLQARDMNQQVLGFTVNESMMQAWNPFFILLFVPLFTYGLYPAISRGWALTPLRKIGIGLFLAAVSFVISGWLQTRIDAGEPLHIMWQVLPYAVLTASEVMVSVTCLEFSYTQAPNAMKSVIMSIYLLSVALGNEITAVVNALIVTEDGGTRLPGATYYWFFAGLMFVAAVGFPFFAMVYRGRTYIQDEEQLSPQDQSRAIEEGIQGGTGG
ncbi:MAG: POT family MFS transporter [Candidatus Paceibacterota bacterium]